MAHLEGECGKAEGNAAGKPVKLAIDVVAGADGSSKEQSTDVSMKKLPPEAD